MNYFRDPAVKLSLILMLALPLGCSRPADIKGDFPATKVSERVYVIHGPNEMPDKGNQGFMNNPAFVVTSKGVVVVDPGSSTQVGEMLLRKITAVTKEPVVAVFNTHIHGDHWLGNQAVVQAWPQAVIYAHPKMIEIAPQAGAIWAQRMDNLTEGATRGTKVVVPNMAVDNDEVLTIGDRHFHIHHNGKAHTEGDLMIEVVEDKVLFLGDNGLAHRAGRMDDGSFKGNIAAMDMALKTPATVFVPGHGKTGGREVPQAYQAWHKALYAAVTKYREQGMSDFEMKDKVAQDLAAYKDWAMFDSEIGKLVSLAYLQSEAEDF